MITVNFDARDTETLTWKVVREVAFNYMKERGASSFTLTQLALATPDDLRCVVGLGKADQLSDHISSLSQCRWAGEKLAKDIMSRDYE